MFDVSMSRRHSSDGSEEVIGIQPGSVSRGEAETESFLPSSNRTAKPRWSACVPNGLCMWKGISALLAILLVLSLMLRGQTHWPRYSYETGFATDLGTS